MAQVNFRVSDDEKAVLDALAKHRGVSVAELAKQAVMQDISRERVNLAFQLLKEGKIARKKAWFLSGLDYHEFMLEWTRRGAEEVIPDEAIEKGFEIARNLDLDRFLKEPRANRS
ncbi:MAG: ribbon-helix-helix protein, CopG family [Candidatus Lokiarchaeota archaeon]|nr:ribbon-helix-helix protein, CopG family [Candidatus Lokiarchaeota archaeon]